MRQSLELSILLIYEVDGDGRLHVMWVYILFVSFVVIFFLPPFEFCLNRNSGRNQNLLPLALIGWADQYVIYIWKCSLITYLFAPLISVSFEPVPLLPPFIVSKQWKMQNPAIIKIGWLLGLIN